MSQRTHDPRQIDPDDPRHGTYAGYLAHYRAGETVCDACLTAQYRHNKMTKWRHAHGIKNRIELGKRAWKIIDDNTRTQLHHASGINRNMLSRLHAGGPSMLVNRATRDRILAAEKTVTPIGIQRRLQALAVMGHSADLIASRIGIHSDPLKNLRRKPEVHFVRHAVAEAIVTYYDANEIVRLEGVGAEITRTHARKSGWLSPLAWDDIDRDVEPPNVAGQSVDEVAIQRRMSGDQNINLTRTERVELIRQWRESGRSMNDCERITGINGWRELRKLAKKEVA